MYTLFAQWIPQQERGVAFALVLVGGNIGSVVTMPLSAYLSENGFAGGWPSVFYVLGCLGLVTFALWMYYVYDTPSLHPKVKPGELMYIARNLDITSIEDKTKSSKKGVPWIAMVKSPRMWAVAVAKFCGAWGQLMLMS